MSRSKATIQHLVWTSVIILAFAVTTYADQEKGELLFEHPWEDHDAYAGFLKEFSEQGGFDIIFDPPPASDAWADLAIALYLGDDDAAVAALEKALLEGKIVDDNGVHVTDWFHNVSVYRPAENYNYEPDDPLPKVKYCDYVGTGHYTLDRLVTEFHVVNAKGQDLETKEILPKEYIWDLSGERTSGIRVRTARSQFD